MPDILKEIMKSVPESAKISDAVFEGANIVLYTKSRDFFLDNNGIIRDIVNTIKKRIEVRPDPAMTMDLEQAEKTIKSIVPKDAGEVNIIFDAQRSRVIIEAEKPGLAIGKSGETLKEIKKQTLWVPLVRRIPSIRSKLIENIRTVLYENNDYRRNFLNKIGEKIYNGWQREKKNEWVRLTVLGGGRQVGRSCFLIQTQESKILLDAGVDVAAPEKYAYPFFDVPEFNVNEIDAIILSHPHSDHSAMIPMLFKYGYRGPVYCTAPTRDITALMTLDYIGVAFKEAKKAPYSSSDVKEMVKHTVCLDYEEVSDITTDVRLTLYNAGHTIGSAMVHLHIGNGLHNFLYTGDLKYQKTQLLEPAMTKFPRLETVMIEATYGGKTNTLPEREECEKEIIDAIQRTIKRGGKALIPVLGVGRAQEVMLVLEKL
ncbi:beta-CASP ribonuclease aCPSF1, partial [archaeon]|nr:beta-CASP ribonuclease aCPSF1 [archaeon]